LLLVSATSSHLSEEFSLDRRPLNPLRRLHLVSPTFLARSLGREDCLTFFSDPIDSPCMNPKSLLEGDPLCSVLPTLEEHTSLDWLVTPLSCRWDTSPFASSSSLDVRLSELRLE
jgi:hypothetical protein